MSPREQSAEDAGRPEHRLWLGAFVTLAGILLAHALLETARDALFLMNIPPERLPWVYLLIAVAAVALARATAGTGKQGGQRRRLVMLQLLASLGTGIFWVLASSGEVWVFYALYVWSGVITSVLVARFWLALSDLFTITEGKRIYASIGMGGAVGSLAGFALATGLSTWLPAQWLLLAAAVAYALSAVGPIVLFEGSEEPQGPVVASERLPRLSQYLAAISNEPYARRVAALVVLASLTFTLGDFLFKSVLVEHVARDDLARWLGTVYLGLNVGSLFMLAFCVTPLVRRISVHRALAVLPLLISLAALGILSGGGIAAIVLLKGADGTLRFSLQKTVSELLYLPMRSDLRVAVRTFGELLGEKGARALASIGILLVVPMQDHTLWLAGALVLLAVAWCFAALELRESYLDTFRRTLSEGSIETFIDHPDLDLASLETLIRALNHPDENHVLAALQLLADKRRVELIPTLILYHPSPHVVTAALELFASEGRNDFRLHADRLLDHPDASVRAAAVRALWTVSPDRERLEQLSRSECSCIRITAVAGRIAHGWIDPESARAELDLALAVPEAYTRLAVAAAARLRYAAVFREPLLALGRDADLGVRREAVLAIRRSADAYFTMPLVELLDDGDVREEVRTALVERGDPALDALARALVDSEFSTAVRRHVPGTISRFGTPRAADVLLQAVGRVGPGMVRYKVLRGLVPLLSGPLASHVDKSPVARAVDETIERALALLHWGVELAEEHGREPARKTIGGALLLELLRDKERLATRRVFLLLDLLHDEADFREIWTGLESDARTSRASGLELLENVLPPDQRRAVLALISHEPPARRWVASGSRRAEAPLSYARLLEQLARDESTALNAFALYHMAELRLELRPEAEAILTAQDVEGDWAQARQGPFAKLRERALELIENLPGSPRVAASSTGARHG